MPSVILAAMVAAAEWVIFYTVNGLPSSRSTDAHI
jgi:hypothetical protein